jgi:hypothetical protein
MENFFATVSQTLCLNSERYLEFRECFQESQKSEKQDEEIPYEENECTLLSSVVITARSARRTC